MKLMLVMVRMIIEECSRVEFVFIQVQISSGKGEDGESLKTCAFRPRPRSRATRARLSNEFIV